MNETTHADASGLVEPHRNKYFYGKLLDVGHLEMEQRYFNRKRWLLNRLALGSGVLCGLRVSEADGKLIVAPGVAVDGLGREIVVPHPIELDPWHGVDEDGVEHDWLPGHQRTVYVCLEYRECLADFAPALVSECGSAMRGMPGTVVESYRVCLHAVQPATSDVGATLCEALITESGIGRKRSALCELVSELECSPSDVDPCVVLATVLLGADGSDERTVDVHPCENRSVLYSNERLFELVLCLARAAETGSTTPAPAPADLTRIARTSWRHDSEIALRDFPDELTVRFSKDEIKPTTKHGLAWFIVTLEAPSGDQAAIARSAVTGSDGGSFSTSVVLNGTVTMKGNTAIFATGREFIDRIRALPQDVAPSERLICRVVVKCDFLLDGSGQAVDGNHLGGRLPTGDGVPGGEFESWFFVTV